MVDKLRLHHHRRPNFDRGGVAYSRALDGLAAWQESLARADDRKEALQNNKRDRGEELLNAFRRLDPKQAVALWIENLTNSEHLI
jgi:hypothetical protein